MKKMETDFQKRVYTADVSAFENKKVLLLGWVHKIRSLGGVNFIILRDKKGIIQVVADASLKDVIKDLTLESVIKVLGVVKKEPRAINGYEVEAQSIEIISLAKFDLPIEINKTDIPANLDVILDHRPISLRNLKQRIIFSIQAEIAEAFRKFFLSKDFVEIFPPAIVFGGTEGGAELFKVDYYKKKAYLAQSPQFYKQIMVGVFERVFAVDKAFRAELHDTSRHLSEFTSLDVEMGFINNERDLIEVHIEFLNFLLDLLREKYEKILKDFNFILPVLPSKVPILSLKEAHFIIERETKKKVEKEDLSAEDERVLGDYFSKKEKSDFLFIVDWPAKKRPMYAMPHPENPNLTLSFDLLVRGLETTTGGQRIHNYEMQVEKIKERGLNPQDFEFYLEIFKYGMPPHGGFAIGLERLTMQFLGLKNVREATLFPRDIQRLIP